MPNSRLNRFLEDAPLWNIGAITAINSLTGGLTNINYRLTTASGDYVLRLNHPQSHLLGINRHLEHSVLKVIANASYAPEIVYACPRHRYLVSVYFDTANLEETPPSRDEEEQLSNIINQYQQLTIPGHTKARDYIRLLDSYAHSAAGRGGLEASINLRWREARPQLKAFCDRGWSSQLCHHDINPANIIRTDKGLKILDWEFAHSGHPLLDYLHYGLNNLKSHPDYSEVYLLNYWLGTLWLALRATV